MINGLAKVGHYMATVTLRAYLDELEALSNRQALEEVVGHCRYILQTFPKNVAVYRILGRALLRRDDQQEALDVFQRVLSAVPDDLIAHRSLADLYKEQESIPQAIWHLERAFEIDPNDSQIREGLRSLYQRQSGSAPDRLAMTRGGLAYMHFRSQAYDQAIAELQGMLAKEPDRIDLLSLYARTMWAYQRPTVAADLALRVLEVLPDAIDAIEIMARLWLQYRRPTDARIFLEKLQALDPFRAINVVKPGDPDAALSIELPHLDWGGYGNAAMMSQTPDWMEGLGQSFPDGGNSGYDPFGLNVQPGSPRSDWASSFAVPAEEAAPAIDWFSQPDTTLPSQLEGYGDENQGYQGYEQNYAPPVQPFSEQSQDFAGAVPDWFSQLDLPGKASGQPANQRPGPSPAQNVAFGSDEFGVPDYLQNADPSASGSDSAADLLPPWLQDDPAVASAPPSSAPSHAITRLGAVPATPAIPSSAEPAYSDWNTPISFGDSAASSPEPEADPFASLWPSPAELTEDAPLPEPIQIVPDWPIQPELSTPPEPPVQGQWNESDWMTNLPTSDAPVDQAPMRPEAPDWLTDLPTGEGLFDDRAQSNDDQFDTQPTAGAVTQTPGFQLPEWLDLPDPIKPAELQGESTLLYPPGDPRSQGWRSESLTDEELVDQMGPPTTQFATPPMPADVPDWLIDMPELDSIPVPDANDFANNLPDASPSFAPDTDQDAPDWLREIPGAEYGSADGSADVPADRIAVEAPAEPEDDVPTWLKEMPVSDNTSDQADPMNRVAGTVAPANDPLEPELDWLTGLNDDAFAPPADDLSGLTASIGEPSANAWPESASTQRSSTSGLSARVTASLASTPTASSIPSDSPIDAADDQDNWLGSLRASAQDDSSDQPATYEPTEPTFSFPPEPESTEPIPLAANFVDSSKPPISPQSDQNDWLSSLDTSKAPAHSDDWLTQFGVVGETVEPPSNTDQPPVDDNLPDWLREPSANVESSGSNTAPEESSGSGMTGLLSALHNRPPAESETVEDPLPAIDGPDWLAAFTGDPLPEPEAEPVDEAQPETSAEAPSWMQEPDFSAVSAPAAKPPPEDNPIAEAFAPRVANAEPNFPPSIFDQIGSEEGTDWLSSFDPLKFDSEKPTKSAFEFKQPPAWKRGKGSSGGSGSSSGSAGNMPPAQT